MCTVFAADSPEFLFHHGFLDNIWYRWQQKSKDRLEVFFKKNKQNLLASPYTAEQFVDSHKLPMCTIVKYEDFITGKTPPKLSGMYLYVLVLSGMYIISLYVKEDHKCYLSSISADN